MNRRRAPAAAGDGMFLDSLIPMEPYACRTDGREAAMLLRGALTIFALALASWMLPAILPVDAQVLDLGKYPDLKGQWRRAPVPGAVGQPPHDPSKPYGRGQEAPLTPEYQAIF